MIAIVGILFLLLLFAYVYSISKFSVKVNQKKYANLFGGGILFALLISIVGSIINLPSVLITILVAIAYFIAIYGYIFLFVKGACLPDKVGFYGFGILILEIVVVIVGILLKTSLVEVLNLVFFFFIWWLQSKVLERFFKKTNILPYILGFPLFFFFAFTYLALFKLNNLKSCEESASKTDEKVSDITDL